MKWMTRGGVVAVATLAALGLGAPVQAQAVQSAEATAASLESEAEKLRDQVNAGGRISDVIVTCQYFPTFTRRMIAAGEESGRLGEVLEEISTFYSKALRDAIKAVTGMIEPIMIIIMGSVVGFIAMAIILPIFKMSNIVGG